MKKGVTFVLLAVLFVFAGIQPIHASVIKSFGFFGGKITDIPATEVMQWADEDYICPMYNGVAISILPISSSFGMPSSYFISSINRMMTRSEMTTGRLIIGRYSGRTDITCSRPTPDPDDDIYAMEEQVVSLPTVDFFGVSGFSFGGGASGGAVAGRGGF